MESGEVKVEAEDFMSRDDKILVEIKGEIDVAEEGKSVLDGSSTENVKVRKRGRHGENHDVLGMETGESEGGKENFRVKREKGLDNGINEEEVVENRQDDVDMRESGCDVGENGEPSSSVEEGKVMEGDKDSLGEGLKESDVSSSAEAEKAHCSGREELEEGDIGEEMEEGNDSEKEKSKVETEGPRSRVVRKSRILAMEKIGRLCSESNDEDEGISKRGKKRVQKKKNNNGTSTTSNGVGDNIAQMEDGVNDEDEGLSKRGKKKVQKKNNNGTSTTLNGVGDNIAQMEDGESTQRRKSLRKKGTGEGEGKELNETVTKTRASMKRDENVGRIWKFLS